MKSLIKSIVFVFLLMNLALTIQMSAAHADDVPASCYATPYSPFCVIQAIKDETNLPDFYKTYQHPDAPDDTEYEGVTTLTSPLYYAIDVMRIVISSIAVLVIIGMALRLIGGSSEEEVKKAKDAMIYTILGLILIQLAAVIVKKMFFGEYGEAFVTPEDEEAVTQEFAQNTVAELQGIVGFINIFLASVAVLVIIVRGFMLIVSAGEEEAMTKAKKHILYAAGGLIIASLSEFIIGGFIFPKGGEVLPNIAAGREIIIRVTNFLSGFVAIAAFLMLFYAGYRYVAGAGSDDSTEKVKKIFFGALIGLILALGAFALVNTFLDLEVSEALESGIMVG